MEQSLFGLAHIATRASPESASGQVELKYQASITRWYEVFWDHTSIFISLRQPGAYRSQHRVSSQGSQSKGTETYTMSLDCRSKPECPEEPRAIWGVHANSTLRLKVGIKSQILEEWANSATNWATILPFHTSIFYVTYPLLDLFEESYPRNIPDGMSVQCAIYGTFSLQPRSKPYHKLNIFHCKLLEPYLSHPQADMALLATQTELVGSPHSDWSKCTEILVICIKMHGLSEVKNGIFYILFIIWITHRNVMIHSQWISTWTFQTTYLKIINY